MNKRIKKKQVTMRYRRAHRFMLKYGITCDDDEARQRLYLLLKGA